MKYLLLLLACSRFFFSIAQPKNDAIQVPPTNNNTIKFEKEKNAVLAFYPGFWAPGLKLERATTSKGFSYGFHARGHIFILPGGKIEPFIRWYISKNAPEGGFLQFKGYAGMYDRNMLFFRGIDCYYSVSGQLFCPGDFGYVRKSDFIYMFGVGISGGYQFLLGKEKKFAFDIFGGIQAIVPTNRTFNGEQFAVWMLRGFPLELGIRMGKAF